MKKYTVLSGIAMILGSVFLTLFVLELIVRAIFSDRIVLFPRYHSEVQYGDFRIRRIRPNTVFWHTSLDGTWKFEINSQGFRSNRDFDYFKPDSLLRVICLGDSHTEGFEVRQSHTFASVLEKELQSHGKPAEVYNMGVSGFGTDEALILFENEAMKYHPDYVVLAFFANDYEDNLKTGLFSVSDTVLVNTGKENLPGVRILDFINDFYIIRKLSENSYLYSICFNTVWDIVKAARIEKAKAEAQTADTLRSYAIVTNKQRTQKELQLTAALLERLFRFAESNRIPIILVDIPQFDQENSLHQNTKQLLESRSFAFIEGRTLVEPYKRYVDTHAPNGHRHISEFTHMMIGLEIANRIMNNPSKITAFDKTQLIGNFK